MAEDEDRRGDERREAKGSNDKASARGRWRKRGGKSSQDLAVEIVDRLEHALRNLFK